MKGSRRQFGAVLTLTGMLAAAGACGSDDDSDSLETTEAGAAITSGPTTTGDSSAPRSTSDATEGDGSTYKIVTIIDNGATQTNPSVAAAVEARVEVLNDQGGINGHPIEVITCDTQFDANVAATCARDAANDPDVIATVGTYAPAAGTDGVNQILEEAGLAAVGNFPASQSDLKSPIAFPVSIGGLGGILGEMQFASQELGAAKVSEAISDVPAGRQIADVIGPLGKNKALDITVVPVPLSSADLSAQVQQASKDMDAVMINLPSETGARFVETARQLGVNVPLIGSTGWANSEILESLAAFDAEFYLQTFFNHSVDAYGEYVDAVEAHDDSAGVDDQGLNAWVAMLLFEKAAGSTANATRASVLEALETMTSFDSGGLTPMLDFTKAPTEFDGAFPRLFNPSVGYSKLEDGKVVPVSDELFFPFEYFAGA